MINKTKKEYLVPHCFADGLKFLEFGCSRSGTLTALAVLLRQSTGHGGGDLPNPEAHEVVGSWVGDHIAIIGDYDDSNLYGRAAKHFKNISHEVMEAMKEDEYLARDLAEARKNWNCGCENG